MREIKFRAWDKDDKVMRSWKEVQIQKDYGEDFYFLGYKENKAITRFDHDQILLQYTGLKDKNGKEIYEGDIHEYGGCHFSVKFGYYTDEDTNVEMYGWHFDSNSIEEQGSLGGSLGVDSEEYVKIVGNIYENQELMEVPPNCDDEGIRKELWRN